MQGDFLGPAVNESVPIHRAAGSGMSASRKSAGATTENYVANGVRLMDDQDLLGSLPWFAEALELDQGDLNV